MFVHARQFNPLTVRLYRSDSFVHCLIYKITPNNITSDLSPITILLTKHRRQKAYPERAS